MKIKRIFIFICLLLPLYSFVHCEFEGMGDVTWISVNFADPDGDCKSDFYESWHFMNDGSVVYTPWGSNWGMLDFNHWGCCNDYVL